MCSTTGAGPAACWALASNHSTRFCKVRPAPASQHVAPFFPYAINATGSRQARHHQNRLETSSTPFTTRGHATILELEPGLATHSLEPSGCVSCSVSVLFVCTLFCVRGVARGLTALAFASTPSLRERPRCTARQTFRIRTPPTPMRAVPGSRATCSPLACLGTKVAAARCVNPCLADLLGMGWKRCCAISANARSGPHHPCGLYSTEARDSETHPRRHGSPVQMSPRLKTPVSPSSNPVDGKGRVPSAHVRDRG